MGERELVLLFCRCMGQMGLARRRWAATLAGSRGSVQHACRSDRSPQLTSLQSWSALTVPEKICMGAIIFPSMRVRQPPASKEGRAMVTGVCHGAKNGPLR